MRTIIIGIGKPLHVDDSVGLLVARLLQDHLAAETGIDVTELRDGGLRLVQAMTGLMDSPKMKAIDVRFQAAMKKLEACAKLAPEKMMACMTPVQAENEKIGAERTALMAEAEIAGSPQFGCMTLTGSFSGDSEGSNCSGHRNGDRLPMKWSWTSP